MDYKTVFIVDPVKGERLQLAKLLKQEKITVAAFVKLTDCFKKTNPLKGDVVIYVLRRGKTEMKALNKVNSNDRKIPFVIFGSVDSADIRPDEWHEKGFRSVNLAASTEKVKEITYNIISPDGPVPERDTQQMVPLI